MSKTNCPYCHHPSFEDISPIDLPEQDPFNKVDELYHKIRQLDETVAQLSKNRVELLQELNEVQSSIGVLPREILSYMFQFACPPPEFGSSFSKMDSNFTDPSEKEGCSSVERSQVLNKVAANWRRTVMTTPQLWTSLTLCIKITATERHLYLLRHFLEYSGHLPLTLSIYLSRTHFHDDILVHPSIDALLVKNLWRIINLELNSPRQVWSSPLPQFGRLTRFILDHGLEPPPQFSLSHIPSLTELTLSGYPVTFSSPYLTVLHVHRVPLNATFQILINCLSFIKLRIGMSDSNL